MKPERLATIAATKRERDGSAAASRLLSMIGNPPDDGGRRADVYDVDDVQRVIARSMAKTWRASGLSIEAWEAKEGMVLAEGLRAAILREARA